MSSGMLGTEMRASLLTSVLGVLEIGYLDKLGKHDYIGALASLSVVFLIVFQKSILIFSAIPILRHCASSEYRTRRRHAKSFPHCNACKPIPIST
jgi:hypothetical protein